MRNSYRLQMCSMGMLSISLTEQEMNALYQIHHCDTFSLTEQTSSEAWQTIQQHFLEKVAMGESVVGSLSRTMKLATRATPNVSTVLDRK